MVIPESRRTLILPGEYQPNIIRSIDTFERFTEVMSGGKGITTGPELLSVIVKQHEELIASQLKLRSDDPRKLKESQHREVVERHSMLKRTTFADYIDAINQWVRADVLVFVCNEADRVLHGRSHNRKFDDLQPYFPDHAAYLCSRQLVLADNYAGREEKVRQDTHDIKQLLKDCKALGHIPSFGAGLRRVANAVVEHTRKIIP